MTNSIADNRPATTAKKSRPRPRATLENKVIALLVAFRDEGRSLPALRAVSDDTSADDLVARLDLGAISNFCRHHRAADLMAPDIQRLLADAVAELGLAYRSDGPPTFRDLAAGLASQNVSAGDCAALESFRETLRLDEDARLDAVFAPDKIEPLQAAYLGSLPTSYTRARRAKPLARVIQRAQNMIIDRGLPESFSGCLRELLIREGLSIEELARRARTSALGIRRWIDGAQPRHENLAAVERITAILGAAAGVLTSRTTLACGRVVSDDFITEHVRKDFESADVPLTFLLGGDLVASPMDRRVAWVYDHIIAATTYAKYIRAGLEDPHRYSELSPIMSQEWDAVADFKTSDSPDPTILRTKRVPFGNGLTKTLGGRWRQVSGDLVLTYIKRTLEGLRHFLIDSGFEESWIEKAGLGFLAFPECHHRAGQWIAGRRYQLLKTTHFFQDANVPEPKAAQVYAYADINRLRVILGLFNAETGYLFHNPPLLSPIPGLIAAGRVAAAKADWPGTVSKLRAALAIMIENMSSAVVKVRDPALPVQGLIDLPRPMGPVYDGLDLMAAQRPDARGSLIPMAQHDRDILISALVVHTKMRRKNYGRLTWKPTNDGHLRYINGRWILFIPRGELKNKNTTAIKGDGPLELELDHRDPLLYAVIERWIGKPRPDGTIDETGSSRTLRHGDSRGNFIFPGDKPGAHICDNTTNNVFRSFTALYVAECPWRQYGIKGVMPFGVHAIRDLAVTDVLACGGSHAQAAKVIWDTEATVRKSYAHLSNRQQSLLNNRWFQRGDRRPLSDSQGAKPGEKL